MTPRDGTAGTGVAWTLAKAKERARRHPRLWVSPACDAACHDRAQLLAMVERLTAQLDEASTCITTLRSAYVDCSEHARAGEWMHDPRCGWCQAHDVRQRCNALLRELEGAP